MKITPRALVMTPMFFIGGIHANAAVLFSDSFEAPVTAGTTLSNGATPANWGRSSTTLIQILRDTASDGVQSIFLRDGTRTLTQSSAVAIPTGSGNLLFTFDYKGDSTLEAADGLTFRINFGQGGGYEDVLRDEADPDGLASSTYSGTKITLTALTPTGSYSNGNWESYSITVPETYYSGTLSATSFQMQFFTNGSSSGENFHLDNIKVSTVPEPSASLFILCGLAGLVGFRRVPGRK